MLRQLEKLGLRGNLFIAFAAVLVLFITLSGVFVSVGVRDALATALQERQTSDARLLAGQVVEALTGRRDEVVAQVLEENGLHADDDAYAIVLHADRSI